MNSSLRRILHGAVSAACLTAALALTSAATARAAAEDPLENVPETVSADVLPTVQINGVVWDQAIHGTTVYAVGNFTSARPAGSPAGTNETPRKYMLAYNLTTGALITGFNAYFNSQVQSVSVAPDGSAVYVGGQFTTANGQPRTRIAALNPTTGAPLAGFAPTVNGQVNSVHATGDSVYFGGTFTQVNGEPRLRAAAVTRATGQVTGFAPQVADLAVRGIAARDGKVAIGGSFQAVNGSSDPGYGLAMLDAGTGASLPMPANRTIRNGGPDAAIWSLRGDASGIYGTGYHFGDGGTIEGAFATDWDGNLRWNQDCHGDTYDAVPAGEVVYTVSHHHYCGNVGTGGFPQTEPWSFYRAGAATNYATGVNSPDIHGYPSHGGEPSPTILNFFPSIAAGTFTGATQGAWDVEASANGDYVVMGGEFPVVGGKQQQGLVRFAKRRISPHTVGPVWSTPQMDPVLKPAGSGRIRISWGANWDRDDSRLTYRLHRTSTTVVKEVTQNARFWESRPMTFTDTGLTPGNSYRYRVQTIDQDGNSTYSGWITGTAGTGDEIGEYGTAVLADGATTFWRLDDTSALTYDWAGADNPTAGAGVTRGTTGALLNSTNAASSFAGDGSGLVVSKQLVPGPDTFSTEVWFRTTSTTGGKIAGFGSASTGTSGSYDRHLYMTGGGQLRFGTYTGVTNVVGNATAYNDGAWHQAVATLGSSGMALYVDGKRVGARSTVTTGQDYTGYWRLGGDNSWDGDAWFDGDVDEFSLYPSVLTAQQINAHWMASGRPSALKTAPTDGYGAAVFGSDPDLYWRLGETSGTRAADASNGDNPGTIIGAPEFGRPGIAAADAALGVTRAADGNPGTNVVATQPTANPTAFTEEVWIRTSTTSGGRVLGFGNSENGANSSNYDRHLYMLDDGRVRFGVYNGSTVTIDSASALNDDAWHHVVATFGADGMRLYVDGELNASHPNTSAQDYTGRWKVGGDNTWGGNSSQYFAGDVDEVAVYPRPLPADEITAHYRAGTADWPNTPPSVTFSWTSRSSTATFDSVATDPGGRIAAYRWDFGDGATSTLADPAHTYAGGGTYTVRLEVTDDDGATAETTHTVTVASAPPLPSDAYGRAVRESDPDLYWRLSEPTGVTTATDTSLGENPGSYFGSGTRGRPGIVAQDAALGVDSGVNVVAAKPWTNPQTFSQEVWLRTTTTTGGRILGFGNSSTNANSSGYDRQLYMLDSGVIRFGTWTGSAQIIDSTRPLNDGQWHHVVVSLGGTGMRMYVDGEQVSSSPNTAAQDYTGWWKIGGDHTWGGHTSASFTGDLDEVAVYRRVLSATEVQAHHAAASGGTPNIAPTADFSASVSGLTADFTSTASDADGTIASYAWDFGDGATSTQANPSHTYAAAGFKTVTLTVTDDEGAQTVVTRTVLVKAPNQAPAAAFTADVSDLTVAFASTSTDADGTIASYAWDFGDGATSTQASPTHTYATGGDRTVTLTVTDDEGATDTVTRTVRPAAPNQAPTAEFTSVVTDLKVDFTSTSTDSDGSIAAYAWQFGDGTTSTQANPSHTYASPGFTTVTLTVTDDDGATAQVVHQVVVAEPANTPPTAAFTSAVSGLSVEFSSNSTDGDGTIAAYAWEFGDGATSTQANPTHTYATAGDKTVRLTVTDDDGATATVARTVTTTVPPANADPTAAFTSAVSGLTAAFTSTSTDGDGTIAAYAWDFGDGATSTQPNPSHTYATAGDKTVRLTVTDDDGATASVSRVVTVTAASALAADDFGRTVATGWGSADTGGAWTIVGSAANASVGGGTGRLRSAAAGQSTRATLTGVSSTSTDLTARYELDKVANGGGVFLSFGGRAIGTNDYRAKVKVGADGVQTVTLVRVVANAETTLGTAVLGSTLNYTAGATMQIRVQVDGTSPTTVRAKVWRAGTTEPSAWTVSRTDATAGLQAAGGVTLMTYLSGSATNAPVTASFDAVRATTVGAGTPPVNAAPTAAFTSAVSGLTAAFTSTSTDGDGTIAAYAWDFGDGSTSSQANPSHAYATAGDKTVRLTVTDDDGATATATRTVTVTSPPADDVLARDAFGRSVSGGWGTADAGGAWTRRGSAAEFSVASGRGILVMQAPGGAPRATLGSVSSTSTDVTATYATDKAGTGGGIYVSLGGRATGAHDYRAKIKLGADGLQTLYLVRMVDGVESTLGAVALPTTLRHVPGEAMQVRLQVTGTAPTTIRARVWRPGTSEPTAWAISRTDSTAALQAVGGIAVLAFLSGSSTNAPVQLFVDDVVATRP